MTPLRIIKIIDGTSVDGPGFRTSIYFAGCGHGCPGCHNPQSHDFSAGFDADIPRILERIEENRFNVTFSGGDPLFQMPHILPLARAIKDMGKTLWLYTGFTYEQIMASNELRPILEYVDVLVDGPFIIEQRDISLRFRGSTNQRLIDVAASTPSSVVLWTPEF